MIHFNESTWASLFSTQNQAHPALVTDAFQASSEQIWSAFTQVCSAKKQGHPEASLRFYLEQNLSGLHVYSEIFDPGPFLPEDSHSSFREYAASLDKKLGGQRFGIVVNNLHMFDFEFWQNTRSFFEKVFSKRGFPDGGASFDLFFGNYQRTPFGIHKDDQDVYTWVLDGNKRFHLWPFERLSGRPEFSQAQEGLEKKGAKVRTANDEEYQSLLQDSIVLDARPGDVMFWPASYWHCADNPEGSLALTIGPGVVFDGNLVASKTQSYWEESLDHNKHIKSKGLTSLLRKIAKDEQIADFQKEIAKAHLAAQTGSFYFHVPAPLEMKALPEDSVLRSDPRSAIRWLPLSKVDWVFSANGHATVLCAPASILQKLATMFELINSGKSQTIEALLADFRGRSAHARGAALEILALLVSWRAASLAFG
jgi:50S ribosomal protein L16 3-hydroxylase